MEYYELYIGQITVNEFLLGFDSFEQAIENVIAEWVWEDPVPDDFREVILTYCTAQYHSIDSY